MAWLRRWVPRPGARLRLLCFPCAAGSAAAYRTWAGRLPEHIEVLGVELPGHGDRRGEPLLHSVGDVVEGLIDECGELLRRPVAVHGHSLGALLDVELMDAYRPGPAAPPRCPVRVYAGTDESGLSADGLAAWRRENPADFLLSRLPGGHFFLRDNEPLYLARIARDLTGTQQNGAV